MSLLVGCSSGPYDFPDDAYRIEEDTVTITAYDGNKSTLRIPKSIDDKPVTKIDAMVFAGNTSLEEVILPSTVRTIGRSAFLNTENLETLSFDGESELKRIESSAFMMSDLEEFALPDGLQHIGDNAFAGNASLKEVTLPDSLETIGAFAFGETPWYNAFDEGFIYEDDVLLGYRGEPSSLQEYSVEDGTRIIAENTFKNSDLESLTIPGSVEHINAGAFENSESLTHLTFEESSRLKTIGTNAFRNSRLQSLTIPASVKTIGGGAFFNTALKTVQLEASTESPITFDVTKSNTPPFNPEKEDLTITLSHDAYASYTDHPHWSIYSDHLQNED